MGMASANNLNSNRAIRPYYPVRAIDCRSLSQRRNVVGDGILTPDEVCCVPTVSASFVGCSGHRTKFGSQ